MAIVNYLTKTLSIGKISTPIIINCYLSHVQSSINLQQSVTVKAMTEQAEWTRVPERLNKMFQFEASKFRDLEIKDL
jgi:hypothetical protein